MLREFSTTKPGLQQMLKDILQTGSTERLYEHEYKTTKQMGMGPFLSIITLNVNGLNAPTKSKDWISGYKSKTPIYAVYKKPTSKQGIHTD